MLEFLYDGGAGRDSGKCALGWKVLPRSKHVPVGGMVTVKQTVIVYSPVRHSGHRSQHYKDSAQGRHTSLSRPTSLEPAVFDHVVVTSGPMGGVGVSDSPVLVDHQCS